jgi:hypothetical protein
MANLGNAWHIPGNPEPRGLTAMRHPVGAIVAGTAITITSGNQFQGDGNPGNQLQTGSAVFFKRTVDANWRSRPLVFRNTAANNKYYSATIAAGTFHVDDVVEYYLRLVYDDHDPTFVHRDGDASVTTASRAAARAEPFTFTVEDSAVKGLWEPVFALPNVAIHTHVLPNGRVLMWGRRDNPMDSLDVHECTPFVWNPGDGIVVPTPQPQLQDGTTVNLFCSGHAFLPDGRLLVVGGHLADGDGLSQATLYDCTSNSWTATSPMITPGGEEVRRWYPTATTLPDGSVLVASGSYVDLAQPLGRETIVVDLLQVWANDRWSTIMTADGTPLNFIGLPLYPRLHVVSDGRVFMSGTNDRTLLLTTAQPGEWNDAAFRALGNRDYCPAVLYDADKIAYIGGGNDAGTQAPTADVELIDLSVQPLQWRRTNPMNRARRQHNATVLPDGTVLVTGGTGGGGGANNGFNDLAAGQPVHAAERWDPVTEQWTELSAESIDRCYHATAVLLPDATVLSAGGGEYRPDNIDDNDPQDSHRNAQVFLPPYLFKGERPDILSAPHTVIYGESFQVVTSDPAQIGRVSWVSLPSVTHSFDENQRIIFLPFVADATGLTVTAPGSPNSCPPGPYMMFVLTNDGVPSTAAMVQMRAVASAVAGDASDAGRRRGLVQSRDTAGVGRKSYLRVLARQAEVATQARSAPVVIGITGTCPYGIGACWGGAYEALRRLEGVDLVGPIPNADDSTAEVFLDDDRLPSLDRWRQQFQRIVNGSYVFRGIEVTVRGPIEPREGAWFMGGVGREPLRLASLGSHDKIQWDHAARAAKPVSTSEALAFDKLTAAVSEGSHKNHPVTVTGPLEQTATGYVLHVRVVSS